MPVLAILLGSLASASVGAAAEPPGAAGALLERLRASGRAEARIERRARDPLSGEWRSVRGRLALETPDRALLEFPGSGERIALRSDGGEWLQPALGQMLRLGPRNAAAGRRWWALLLPGNRERFRERAVRDGRVAVVSAGAGDLGADTAWVGLDARGLPGSLAYEDPGAGTIEYRFRGWRFTRPHGRSGFVLVPADSLQVIDLP